MNERVVDPYTDEEPTIKTVIPPHVLAAMRQNPKGPNWGMIGCIVFCAGFWSYVLHLLGWF